jgi:simple sugar transport system permease protein
VIAAAAPRPWTGVAARFVATFGLALGVGALVMTLSGRNAVAAYRTLFTVAFLGRQNIADTLLAATPLILTGLATAVAWRAGVFNIGVEGALYLGAFAAAWVGFTLVRLPAAVIIPLAFLAAGVVGAGFSLIPGLLRAYLRVDEIVTTIMLNYVAIFFTSYLVNYPYAVPGLANAMSPKIAPAAVLPRLLPPSQLNLALIVALLMVPVAHLLMTRTALGYEQRALGTNPLFARWSGMPVAAVIVKVMLLSGFIGGLAGAGQVLGVNYRFVDNFSPGYGYDGITIALLGRNTALGSLLAAVLLGALRSGGATIELFMDIPKDLILILEATIIFFVTAEYFFSVGRRARHGEPH